MAEDLAAREVIEQAKGRGAVYFLLSRAFSRPDASFHKLGPAVAQLMTALEVPSERLGSDLDLPSLEFEYNRLFVGPSRLPCPPYESVHRKDRPEAELGLVMGPSTRDVLRCYREAGFVVSPGFKDLPDHLQVELEFMHRLCMREMEQPESAWTKRREEFAELHLRPWIPGFAECVESRTNSFFYRSAARLLKNFVERDATPESQRDPGP